MMYSEFVSGTGCKDNAHNYKVFKNLEAMYMNTEMSKEEVYEYGKKLVDNSKSKEELELEAKIKSEIESKKSDIKWLMDENERYQWYFGIASDDEKKCYKDIIKNNNNSIKILKSEIRMLKWVLE